MIRVKHIGPDGRVTKTIDITPETSAADIAVAHAAIDGLIAEDVASHNPAGIIAKPLTDAEREAAAAAAAGGTP